ncbi:MAG TPA: DUF4250 domain-containing protein [Candidatus Cottocaccamicrobium excrementipullorum]|nr:DUF4250 domain-containing protein [Candidatus Cottocaccamicrobium excrementipullorum]
MVPKDPVMLLSYVNTQLRDHYSTLEEMCSALDLDQQKLVDTLAGIQYTYQKEQNQFV